jgi:2-phosphosulfolactate phosphatase
MRADTFSQSPYRCRLDWGRRGAREAAERQDILVIVDTLSFSTTAVTAVQHGGLIYPCTQDEDPVALAQRIGGEAAVRRQDVPARGRFSLSPLAYLHLEPGTRIALGSPNGATCSRYARTVPYLFVGALVNAEAVATVVSQLLDTTDRCVTIIACGERWQTPMEDGALRMAIEDYLGAGAILSYLWHDKSPEARVCVGAFLYSRDDLLAALWECGSGRELRGMGFAEDVRHAAQCNVYQAVPVMHGERLERFKPPHDHATPSAEAH